MFEAVTALAALFLATSTNLGLAPSDAAIPDPSTPPAYLAAATPGITYGSDCVSWGPTCHEVFSRSYTKNVLQPAASGTASGLTASALGICKFGGPQLVSACTVIFGAYAGASISAINQAATQNQCVAYVTYFSDAIGAWKTDVGPDCH